MQTDTWTPVSTDLPIPPPTLAELLGGRPCHEWLRERHDALARSPAMVDVVRRPQVGGCRVTTPNAGDMIQLLGSGPVHGGLAVTKSEHRALQRLYGYHDEPPNEKPPAPVAPKREDFADSYEHGHAMREHERAVRAHAEWKDPREFYQAGADRGLMRHAEADGLRIIAWIAKFVPPGEDPLKHVVQAFAALGCDTDPADNGWAFDDDDCDEAEEESAAE